MDKRLELVLHEVERQFRSERAFYHGSVGITQRAWEKYKSGETRFSNIKLSTYQKIMSALFTPYEAMLVDKAIDAVNFNWYENVIEAFHDIKFKQAKTMLNRGASIEQAGAFHEDSEPRRKSIKRIRIVDELDIRNVNMITFQIEIPSTRPEHYHLRVPSGKRNKQEWFEKYFEEIVVK